MRGRQSAEDTVRAEMEMGANEGTRMEDAARTKTGAGKGKASEKVVEKPTRTGGKTLALWTKYLLDAMFYLGIVVTATLPLSVKMIGKQFPFMVEHYEETVIIYFVLGVAAEVLVRELRKIFKTVLDENCFVQENVVSLQKMGNWSFFIALMSAVRSIVYMTVAMWVVIFVFVVAGLFSKVLASVFAEAVRYKEENDLTV